MDRKIIKVERNELGGYFIYVEGISAIGRYYVRTVRNGSRKTTYETIITDEDMDEAEVE